MYENAGKYSESDNHATHVVMVVYVLFELVEEPGEMPSLHARLRNSDLRATRWTRSDARLLAAVTESLVSAYTRHSVDTMERLQVYPVCYIKHEDGGFTAWTIGTRWKTSMLISTFIIPCCFLSPG